MWIPPNTISTSTLESSIVPELAAAVVRTPAYQHITETQALQYVCGIVALEERLIRVGAANLYYIRGSVATQVGQVAEAVPLDHHPLIGPRVAQEIVIRQWLVAPREVKPMLQETVAKALAAA